MAGITHEVEYIGGPSEMTRGTWVWIGAGFFAIALVMFMQWFSVDTRSQTMASAPKSVRQSEQVEWGAYSPFALEAKKAIKLGQSKEAQELDEDEESDEEAEPVTPKQKFHSRIEPLAVTRVERLRLAIVAGELIGKEETLVRLTALSQELEPGSALALDVEWLRRLYNNGPDSVPKEAQDALLDRHEWFGRLALSYGKPINDPIRRKAVGGWRNIQLAYLRVGGLYLLMFVGGVILLIWAGWLVGGRTIVFDNAPGGNHDEYMQTFVLFCGAFVIVCGLALVPFGMSVEGSIGAQIFHDILSWTLPLVIIWPLFRGVKFERFREEIGWTTGQGVLKEVLIGAAAQIAWTPVLLVVAIGLGLIGGLISPDENGVGGYPMFQHPPIEHPVVLFINITSLVIWAPLVEETIFRGLLYGWIRQRLSFRWTVLISSAIFGMIHPYSPLGMLQVAFGGLLFGMLREWRGSLIAPMVAHAINNGVIALVSFMIARAIGGGG